jgi:hypothetical protein
MLLSLTKAARADMSSAAWQEIRSPDFLLNLVALAHFMLLSLTKAARADMSSAAWQEIRVRSG